jgi:class 3 adenylate cyclase
MNRERNFVASSVSPGDIAASLGVRELCVGKAFHFDDLGNFDLKGLPEPTPAYGVCLREVAS